jgi:peptidoglycan/LPS O-acetylase OafA/YrhL
MRKGAGDGFIPELDGLRGIAILVVMIHRVFPRAGGTPWPIDAGWVGSVGHAPSRVGISRSKP